MTENKLTLRLRTKDNLLELLTAGKSAAWKVGKNKENEIAKVQIFNFEGTLMLEASLDISNTSRREDNRLIVGLGADSKIIKCDPPLVWKGMSPIRYFHENSQEESEETEEESSSESIIVECYKKGSQLKIRVVSPGYNPELNVRFPKDLREEGAHYAVEILEEVQGKYYTAKGKIEKLDYYAEQKSVSKKESVSSMTVLERLLQAVAEDIQLWNEWRENNPYIEIDLTGANLTGANLSSADLSSADLTEADLSGADLTGANLSRANLTGADLTGTILEKASLIEKDGKYYLAEDDITTRM